jgi:hypothetical protein
MQGGRVDHRHFDSYVSYHAENLMHRPAWSQWWALNRKHYDPEFAAWVDSVLDARQDAAAGGRTHGRTGA